jgi:hypothetical protein
MGGPNSNGRGGERELLARLVRAVQAAGLPVDPPWITNLYIALKSRPMAVFVGPPGNGKRALAGCLAEVLTERNPASSCRWPVILVVWNVPQSGALHRSRTASTPSGSWPWSRKAWLPHNLGRLFIAYLPQISPAELSGFFAELGYQLQHGELIRLPGAHLAHPVPYPRNLLVIGTLDRCWLDWCDEQVHGMTSLIPCEWPVGPGYPTRWGTPEPGSPPGSALFRSWMRMDEPAGRMLFQRPAGDDQMSSLVRRLESRLRNRGLKIPERVSRSAAIYLANAWSEDGEGLFASEIQANLTIAMDMALVQVVLPPLARALRASLGLRCAVLRDLEDFPRARALVGRMGDGISRMARRPVQSGWEG